MNDVYNTPKADLSQAGSEVNNSGMKEKTYPDGVKGWSWGAFMLNWIWALGNKSYIGLLALLPYVGFVMAIILGIKGREMAWRNKQWDSVEHFNRVQKKWSIWGLVIFGIMIVAIVAAVLLPVFMQV